MGRNITGLKNPIKKGEEHKGLTRTEIFFLYFRQSGDISWEL
ncbi:MAG: hypothetical protein Q4C84_14515 [Bacillota bacterium]|nr:hypothetical protein [Bacillota bacterium]